MILDTNAEVFVCMGKCVDTKENQATFETGEDFDKVWLIFDSTQLREFRKLGFCRFCLALLIVRCTWKRPLFDVGFPWLVRSYKASSAS